MNQKELTWQEEQKHFDCCQHIIHQNVLHYEEDYRKWHKRAQELYKAVSGDPELYNQLMTAVSMEGNAENALRKNRAAAEKPYFGRIDYQDLQYEKNERVYIGKNGVFKNRTDVLIADWRAPISSVYYENELGKGSYGLPDEKPIPIDLTLKRTFSVEKGKLLGYYDSDVASNDELLVQYLSKNKDAVLGEIIATIQKEQNEIIRESPFSNIIVQGVAGSGKTTVAMHRISYLLYNYKDRFESNEYCIIGSSDLLLNYITSGLPELDVPNIKHMRMDQLFISLCEKDWTKKCKVVNPDSTAKLRCGLNFTQQLELFLMYEREKYVDCRPLKDPQLGMILSQSSNETLLRENPSYSVNRLLSTMDERIKTRIKFLMSGGDKDDLQKKLRQYNSYYKNRRPKETIFAFYDRFLENWASGAAVSNEPVSSHLASCQKREYDLYDLAALALIHYRITQKAPDESYGLLFLDEAQDFGISIYYVLKKILPDTYFTIMGDVSQNINYDTGLNDWYELQKLFLTDKKDKFKLLQKSYRNTIEISEYAGKILDAASFGRYKITPVIRHGIPVQEKQFWSEIELAEYTAELIADIRKKSYTTTAVICPDETTAARVSNLLSQYTPLAEGAAENFSQGTMVLPIRLVKGLEFDTVVLWNPNLKEGLKRPDTAKLLYVAATRALHELHVLSC